MHKINAILVAVDGSEILRSVPVQYMRSTWSRLAVRRNWYPERAAELREWCRLDLRLA